MVREHGVGDEIAVPPTIHALLQARIDSLDGDVRMVMERGSVEGEVFHRGSVAVLSPDPLRPAVESHLATLVRKELIRSTPPTFPERRGLPLSPSAHPRRRLRVAARRRPAPSCTSASPSGSPATTSSKATRSSATTSSRRIGTGPSSTARMRRSTDSRVALPRISRRPGEEPSNAAISTPAARCSAVRRACCRSTTRRDSRSRRTTPTPCSSRTSTKPGSCCRRRGKQSTRERGRTPRCRWRP